MVDDRITNYMKVVEGVYEEREGCYDHHYS